MRVADRWFVRTTYDNGITHLVEPHVHRIIRCNIWHIRGRDRDLVVDTGVGVSSVTAELVDLLDRPVVCVATHVHYDHVGCLHEFDERLMHPVGAAQMNPYQAQMPLRWSAFDPSAVAAARAIGYDVDSDELLDALPRADFDLDGFHTEGIAISRTVEHGDQIDLGDRHFEVLELPGHTPCSIGLLETETATLFSGDAVYDGPLIDFLPESNQAAYADTMKRLRDLAVDVVHPGHDPSFGRERLIQLATGYLDDTTTT
jgi:glyoxylase-like metal-dependent hydrolase (beta-lactamase superfamily II)